MKKRINFLFVILLFACKSFAANTFTQAAHNANGTSGSITPFQTTYSSACSSGTTLVITVIIDGSDGMAVTISDPTNGTWTQDKDASATFGANHERIIIASIHNNATSALVVSVFTASATTVYTTIYEITGPPSSSFVDVSGSVNANTNPTISLSAADNDTIIAGMVAYPVISSADTSYTLNYNNGGSTLNSGFYGATESIADAGSAGTKTVNWNSYTAADASYLVNVAVAYKSGGGGGGGGGTVVALKSMMGVGR